jgi:hypothetical protein
MEKCNFVCTPTQYKLVLKKQVTRGSTGRLKSDSLYRKNPISLKQMGHISQASWITSILSLDNFPSSNGFKIDYFGLSASHVGPIQFQASNCIERLIAGKSINFYATEQN